MRLFRTLFGAAVALALVAPAANAQTQVDFTFQLGAGHPSTNPTGNASDYYQGSIDGGDFFQVFCVNPTHFVENSETYVDAWQTPFSAADGSHTFNPNGNVWLGNYTKAATIASLLVGSSTSGPWTRTQVIDIQNAVWDAMGFAGHTPTTDWYSYAYNTLSIRINPDNWFVITDANKDRQEFISFTDKPYETVPEPATMSLLATGLVGMAAAGRRRKNRKS